MTINTRNYINVFLMKIEWSHISDSQFPKCLQLPEIVSVTVSQCRCKFVRSSAPHGSTVSTKQTVPGHSGRDISPGWRLSALQQSVSRELAAEFNPVWEMGVDLLGRSVFSLGVNFRQDHHSVLRLFKKCRVGSEMPCDCVVAIGLCVIKCCSQCNDVRI